MPRVSHLIRRNGAPYWFKIDLPDDLAGRPLPPSIPESIKRLESPVRRGHLKTAVWLSLRTTVDRVAKERVGLQIARHANLFDATRAFMINGATPSLKAERLQDGRHAIEKDCPDGKPAIDQGLTITQVFQSWSIGDEGCEEARTQRRQSLWQPPFLHGSVRLFHFAASHETCAMTFRFHETKKVLTTSILGGNGKVLKRDGFMIRVFTNTEGFNHVQAILLDGHDWNGDCCCSVNFVVASRYATAVRLRRHRRSTPPT